MADAEIDRNLDTLIDGQSTEDVAAARAELAASPEGRRQLAVFEALGDVPDTGPVPDVTAAVMSRVRAATAQSAPPATPERWPNWRGWLHGGMPRLVLAGVGVATVLVLAVNLSRGSGMTTGLSGAAVGTTAPWLAIVVVIVVAVAVGVWWLARR